MCPTVANGIDAIMSNGRNAHDQTYRNSSTRRLRVDDMAAIVVRKSRGRAGNAPHGLLPRGHSGRLLVISSGLTLLVIWGTLYLVFRDWRARYRERASMERPRCFRPSIGCGRLCRPMSIPSSGAMPWIRPAQC